MKLRFARVASRRTAALASFARRDGGAATAPALVAIDTRHGPPVEHAATVGAGDDEAEQCR